MYKAIHHEVPSYYHTYLDVPLQIVLSYILLLIISQISCVRFRNSCISSISVNDPYKVIDTSGNMFPFSASVCSA